MIRSRPRNNHTRAYQVVYPGAESRTFDRRKDAELYELEVRRLAALGELDRVKPETFGEALTRLLAKLEREVRPASMVNLRDAERDLKPLAQVKFNRLRRATVEDLIQQVAARPAPRQAQKALALAKRVCKLAGNRGQRIDSGIYSIPMPRYTKRQPRFLTKDELYELSSWMPEKIRRIVLVAGLTGLRQGELFDLRETDVDLEAGVLHVRQGKTNAARRTVALSAEAVRLLREQLLVKPHGPLVFPTPTGLRWDKSRFMGRVFRPAKEHAGIPEVVFHDCRHSFASYLIQAAMQKGWGEAVTVKLGADALGHSDGGVLFLRTYGHLFGGMTMAVAPALDSLWAAEA